MVTDTITASAEYQIANTGNSLEIVSQLRSTGLRKCETYLIVGLVSSHSYQTQYDFSNLQNLTWPKTNSDLCILEIQKAALGMVTHRHTTSEISGQCRSDPATCTE